MDFKELAADGQAFEQLVRELLFSRGLHVQWSGRGPDGGRDLLCKETLSGVFAPQTRTWLVQCKHKAHSGDSVGISDLDDIVGSCIQHGATGYLLACSTQPSSTVVNRLDGISNNPNPPITAIYWDAVMLERLLSSPRDWAIAQRFMPLSCGEWHVYATENPNRFVAHYKGYVFQLTNRIGSGAEHHLPSIAARISDLEALQLPQGHFVRPRAVWYDDKNGGYTWYIDYMRPHAERPAITKTGIARLLRDGWALEDGQIYSWDISIVEYNAFSDHYDKDHYDYYIRYIPNYLNGEPRHSEHDWGEFYATRQEIESLENRDEVARDAAFAAMVEAFERLPYLRVSRAVNAGPEQIHRLARRFNWSDVIKELGIDVDNLFSALLILDVSDDAKFHALMARLPNDVDRHFRLARAYIYLPDTGRDTSEDEYIYDLRFTLHPAVMTNQQSTRMAFNSYFDAIRTAIEHVSSSIP
jgi:Restriction endonuclease